MFGPVRNGDSFSVTLFGVTFNGTASLGTGYTCAVSGVSGTTSFPVVVSESPAPPAQHRRRGDLPDRSGRPGHRPGLGASTTSSGRGPPRSPSPPRPPPSTGSPSVGGSPSGAVSPNTESASASNLPLSDTLVADTPYTYATTYNPVTFQTGPGTGTVYFTPGDIDAEVTFVIHGTPTPESISCARLRPGWPPWARPPSTRRPPPPPSRCPRPPRPSRTRSRAGTDGGWGATIANTSTATVTGLSASVQVTDGPAPPPSTWPAWPPRGPPVPTAGSGKLTCSIGTLAAGASDTLDVLVDTTGLPDGHHHHRVGHGRPRPMPGPRPTTLGAIGVVVVESGNGTKAVAAPGIALVQHQEAAVQGQGLGTLTLPKAKIKVKKRVAERAGAPAPRPRARSP